MAEKSNDINDIINELVDIVNSEKLEKNNYTIFIKILYDIKTLLRDEKHKNNAEVLTEKLSSINKSLENLSEKEKIKQIIIEIAEKKETIDQIALYNSFEFHQEIVDTLFTKYNDILNQNPNDIFSTIKNKNLSMIEYLLFLLNILKVDTAVQFHQKIICDTLPKLLEESLQVSNKYEDSGFDYIDFLSAIDLICTEALKKEDLQYNQHSTIKTIFYEEETYSKIFNFYKKYIEIENQNAQNKAENENEIANIYKLYIKITNFLKKLKKENIDIKKYEYFYKELIGIETDETKIFSYLEEITTLEEDYAKNLISKIQKSKTFFEFVLSISNTLIVPHYKAILDPHLGIIIDSLISTLDTEIKTNKKPTVEEIIEFFNNNETEVKIEELFNKKTFQKTIEELIYNLDTTAVTNLSLYIDKNRNERLAKEFFLLKIIIEYNKIKNVLKNSSLYSFDKNNNVAEIYHTISNMTKEQKNSDYISFCQDYLEQTYKECLDISALENTVKIDIILFLIKSKNITNEEFLTFTNQLINLLENTNNKNIKIKTILSELLDASINKSISLNQQEYIKIINLYKKYYQLIEYNNIFNYIYDLTTWYKNYIKNHNFTEEFSIDILKTDLNKIFNKEEWKSLKENIIDELIKKYINQENPNLNELKTAIDIIINERYVASKLEDILKIANIYISKSEDDDKIELGKKLYEHIKKEAIQPNASIEYTDLVELIKLEINIETKEFTNLNVFRMVSRYNEREGIKLYREDNDLSKIKITGKKTILVNYLSGLYRDAEFLKKCSNHIKNIIINNPTDYNIIMDLFIKEHELLKNNQDDRIKLYMKYLEIIEKETDDSNKIEQINTLCKIRNMLSDDESLIDKETYGVLEKKILNATINNTKSCYLFDKIKTQDDIEVYKYHIGLINCEAKHCDTFEHIFIDTINKIENENIILYYGGINNCIDLLNNISKNNEKIEKLCKTLCEATEKKLLSLTMEELNELEKKELEKKENKEKSLLNLKEIKAKKLANNIKTIIQDNLNDFFTTNKINNEISFEKNENNEKKEEEKDQWHTYMTRSSENIDINHPESMNINTENLKYTFTEISEQIGTQTSLFLEIENKRY